MRPRQIAPPVAALCASATASRIAAPRQPVAEGPTHVLRGHRREDIHNTSNMSNLDDDCKKEAARFLAKRETDEVPMQEMEVETQKRGHEESVSASSSTPVRVLKQNKSNKEELERMEPWSFFNTEDEEFMPDNNEPAWMRALKGLMQAQTGQHGRADPANRSSRARPHRLQEGQRIISGGWEAKTSRETTVKEATTRLAQQSVELREMASANAKTPRSARVRPSKKRGGQRHPHGVRWRGAQSWTTTRAIVDKVKAAYPMLDVSANGTIYSGGMKAARYRTDIATCEKRGAWPQTGVNWERFETGMMA